MQRSYTITIALILIAALSVTSFSRSDTADTSNTQTGQITAMPIAIDDTEQAPLRLESAFVGVGQTIFVNGIPGQYFPFQKAVLRNVSKKIIVGFTAFLVNQRNKNIERLQYQPLQLKPQEQFTLIQETLLISGEIGDYKIMIVSVTFADGEKWMTKPQSPSNWELIAETNEFPRNCSWASKQMSGIAVNCRGTILGYLDQPIGNRFCQKTTNTLVKSTDSGKTWTDITNSIPDVFNIPIRSLYSPMKYAYLVINQVIADGNNFYMLIGGTDLFPSTLIESNDEGKTWNVVIPKEETGLYLRSVNVIDGEITNISYDSGLMGMSIKGYSITRWDRKQKKWYEIEKKEDGSGTHEGGTIYKLNSSGQMVETKRLNYDAFDGILSESSDKGKTWTEKYRNLRVVREPGRLDYKTDDEISFDQGKTWRKNSITKTEYCKGKTLGQGELDGKKGVWSTGNDGKTWEFLFADDGIPVQINSHIDSTGKIYSLDEGKIYRSKSSLPCSNCGKGNCDNQNDPNKYYIAFIAREPHYQSRTNNSLTGHVFVQWIKINTIAKRTETESWGLYPQEGLGIFGQVPGEIVKESFQTNRIYHTFLLPVTSGEYQQTLEERSAWKPGRVQYSVYNKNCVHFVSKIASRLNYCKEKIILPSPDFEFPAAYIDNLKSLNSGIRQVSIREMYQNLGIDLP